MTCEECGKELELGSKFCDGCGTKINNSEIKTKIDETDEQVSVIEPEEEIAAKEEAIASPRPVSEIPKRERPVVLDREPQREIERQPDVKIVKPLGIFAYLWMFILMTIPIVNVVMIFVWAFGSNKNPNKKNYAWAVIIYILLGVVIWLLLGVVFVNEFENIRESIIDFYEGIF